MLQFVSCPDSSLNSALTYNSGDVLNVNNYRCGGYVTASAASVQFHIPLDKPLASDVGIASSNIQMIIRQNGNYTHGSASSTYVTPSSIDFYKQNNFISLACTMSSTTNATNNDACGIQLGNSSTITFGVATTASPQGEPDDGNPDSPTVDDPEGTPVPED